MISHGGLQTLDVLVAGCVEEPASATPPPSPAPGACYIVADDASDPWTDKALCVAAWTSGGWRFVVPVEGMCLYVRTTGTWTVFRNGNWETGMIRGSSLLIGDKQVVGARAPAIESPAGGTVVDTEVRATVDAILDTLRQHGLIDV